MASGGFAWAAAGLGTEVWVVMTTREAGRLAWSIAYLFLECYPVEKQSSQLKLVVWFRTSKGHPAAEEETYPPSMLLLLKEGSIVVTYKTRLARHSLFPDDTLVGGSAPHSIPDRSSMLEKSGACGCLPGKGKRSNPFLELQGWWRALGFGY